MIVYTVQLHKAGKVQDGVKMVAVVVRQWWSYSDICKLGVSIWNLGVLKITKFSPKKHEFDLILLSLTEFDQILTEFD